MNLALLRADLTRDEGRRLFPYVDTVGKTTIGIGHNLTDDGISEAICDTIFGEDVADLTRDLTLHLPWWTTLSEPRQRVLANMCFQLGIGGLLGFVHTLTAMQTDPDDPAIPSMMLQSKWATTDSPDRAQRLAAQWGSG